MRFLPILCLLAATAFAQEPHVPKVVPVPPLPSSRPAVPEPTSPPARDVTDPVTHIRFHLPAGWALSHTDGELSTFHLDARTAAPRTTLREVATLSFNPYPWSTFAGALFYLSTIPRTTSSACATQSASVTMPPRIVDDIPFRHSHDEHGHMCIESRDEIFTAYRRGGCVRLDLVINTFCADSSGAREITANELDNLRNRLLGVLDTVQLRP
jgi:hypothetical protein